MIICLFAMDVFLFTQSERIQKQPLISTFTHAFSPLTLLVGVDSRIHLSFSMKLMREIFLFDVDASVLLKQGWALISLFHLQCYIENFLYCLLNGCDLNYSELLIFSPSYLGTQCWLAKGCSWSTCFNRLTLAWSGKSFSNVIYILMNGWLNWQPKNFPNCVGTMEYVKS